MKSSVLIGILAVLTTSVSFEAFAELDPELAAASTSANNDAGLFATGYLSFGTSQAVASRPGAAILGGAELGYALPRDSWGRLQASLMVGSGLLNFKDKGESRADQSVSIGLMPLVRGGYGYSLGHQATFLWQVGAGAFLGKYSAEVNDVDFESDSTFLGLVGQLGGQLLLTPTSWFEVVFGLDLTHYAFDVDSLEASGVKASVNRSFNVNSPTLSLGLKIRL